MKAGPFRSLHFAIRPRVLARYLGQLLVIVAGLTLVPLGGALLGGRPDVALRQAVVALAFGALGGAAMRLRCTDRVQANEALVVTALVFVLPGVAMTYPLMAYGIAPLDALFEAVSGITTTGLSTLATLEGQPRAFLFARAWLQWIGGLGVVALALAFVIPAGVAAKRLGFDPRESPDYVGGTRAHARRVLGVYLVLTAGAIALCVAAGMHGFESLVIGMAAVSTGGFSTTDASLAGLAGPARTAVCLACLAGALSFSRYYGGALRKSLRDPQIWILFGLVAAGAAALGLGLRGHEASPWRHAAWMSLSAQTTAGFSTLPVAELPATAKLVLIVQMFIGGEVGSTAGGLKILRVFVLLQLVRALVLRASMPRGSVLLLRVGGSRLRSEEIEAAAAVAVAYASVLVLSWLPFLAYGHDPLDALFDVVSALGTVGLSAGTVGPDLQPALKAVLCLDMIMGRVEIFAFFVLAFPGTWLGRRRSSE
ncbi:MAG TPA: potassium transporter TrkG [Myxococcota bacterium]|nr:potassium transporter TrkG [Myxococcota bacterium]